MYRLYADSDVIAESASRAELRGLLRCAEFKAWAVGAGYAFLDICIGEFRPIDSVDLKGYTVKAAS